MSSISLNTPANSDSAESWLDDLLKNDVLLSNALDSSTVSSTEWLPNALTPTYASTTSFTIGGDQTSIYVANRRLKATLTSGAVYSHVANSSYSGATGLTTVTIATAVLDDTLSAVNVGILTPDGAEPYKNTYTLPQQSSDPSTNADEIKLYAKDVDGQPWPVFEKESSGGVGKLADFDRAAFISMVGASIMLPGSGLTNGKAIALTTTYQTIHSANPPAGYVDYFEIWGQSVDGTTEILISLSSGSSNTARVYLEQENGPYLIMRGISDDDGTYNIQAKADADNDALAWITVKRLPKAADSTSAGVVMPSGSATLGYEYLDTGGQVIHQGGAGSGYCDIVRLFVVSRGSTGVTVTVSDGTNTFISRELPANGWQEFLGEIALDSNDTLTGYASANSLSTLNAMIFRIPTS